MFCVSVCNLCFQFQVLCSMFKASCSSFQYVFRVPYFVFPAPCTHLHGRRTGKGDSLNTFGHTGGSAPRWREKNQSSHREANSAPPGTAPSPPGGRNGVRVTWRSSWIEKGWEEHEKRIRSWGVKDRRGSWEVEETVGIRGTWKGNECGEWNLMRKEGLGRPEKVEMKHEIRIKVRWYKKKKRKT